jgi:glutamate-1-semialdehyde 2,1-aminomutase
VRRRYIHSREWHARAQAVTPGGAQTGSKAPGRVGPLGAFPLYLSHGQGVDVFDVDGHRYIDWFNGNCAVTLGHNHAFVSAAVERAMRRGTLLSLPTRLEVGLAERLVSLIPCAEQVRFVKTGSEACAAAVRIARMATGREIILTARGHYHGWHDWTVVRNAYHPGIPDWQAEGLRTFDANDLDALRLALAYDEGRDIAAVMLEPNLVDDAGVLEQLVALTQAHGALVIFDEMITGARWALGGVHEQLGLTPDLATFGKAFANGHPLAFVAGRRDVMEQGWPISGTFGGETTGLAACRAVLDEYQAVGAIGLMWIAGASLMAGVNRSCARLQLPARMVGAPCRPMLRWNLPEALEPVIVALLQQELAQAGVLVHPSGWNPSALHEGAALDETLQACDDALTAVAAALNSPRPELFLRGELLKPAFAPREVMTT